MRMLRTVRNFVTVKTRKKNLLKRHEGVVFYTMNYRWRHSSHHYPLYSRKNRIEPVKNLHSKRGEVVDETCCIGSCQFEGTTYDQIERHAGGVTSCISTRCPRWPSPVSVLLHASIHEWLIACFRFNLLLLSNILDGIKKCK